MRYSVRVRCLLHGGAHGRLDGLRSLPRSARVFERVGELAFKLHDPRGIGAGGELAGRLHELLFQKRELLLVFAVETLREVLEGLYCFLARLALEKALMRQIEERGGGRESFRGARAEDFSRLIEHEERRERAIESQSAHGENAALFGGLEGKQRGILVR